MASAADAILYGLGQKLDLQKQAAAQRERTYARIGERIGTTLEGIGATLAKGIEDRKQQKIKREIASAKESVAEFFATGGTADDIDKLQLIGTTPESMAAIADIKLQAREQARQEKIQGYQTTLLQRQVQETDPEFQASFENQVSGLVRSAYSYTRDNPDVLPENAIDAYLSGINFTNTVFGKKGGDGLDPQYRERVIAEARKRIGIESPQARAYRGLQIDKLKAEIGKAGAGPTLTAKQTLDEARGTAISQILEDVEGRFRALSAASEDLDPNDREAITRESVFETEIRKGYGKIDPTVLTGVRDAMKARDLRDIKEARDNAAATAIQNERIFRQTTAQMTTLAARSRQAADALARQARPDLPRPPFADPGDVDVYGQAVAEAFVNSIKSATPDIPEWQLNAAYKAMLDDVRASGGLAWYNSDKRAIEDRAISLFAGQQQKQQKGGVLDVTQFSREQMKAKFYALPPEERARYMSAAGYELYGQTIGSEPPTPNEDRSMIDAMESEGSLTSEAADLLRFMQERLKVRDAGAGNTNAR